MTKATASVAFGTHVQVAYLVIVVLCLVLVIVLILVVLCLVLVVVLILILVVHVRVMLSPHVFVRRIPGKEPTCLAESRRVVASQRVR